MDRIPKFFKSFTVTKGTNTPKTVPNFDAKVNSTADSIKLMLDGCDDTKITSVKNSIKETLKHATEESPSFREKYAYPDTLGLQFKNNYVKQMFFRDVLVALFTKLGKTGASSKALAEDCISKYFGTSLSFPDGDNVPDSDRVQVFCTTAKEKYSIILQDGGQVDRVDSRETHGVYHAFADFIVDSKDMLVPPTELSAAIHYPLDRQSITQVSHPQQDYSAFHSPKYFGVNTSVLAKHGSKEDFKQAGSLCKNIKEFIDINIQRKNVGRSFNADSTYGCFSGYPSSDIGYVALRFAYGAKLNVNIKMFEDYSSGKDDENSTSEDAQNSTSVGKRLYGRVINDYIELKHLLANKLTNRSITRAKKSNPGITYHSIYRESDAVLNRVKSMPSNVLRTWDNDDPRFLVFLGLKESGEERFLEYEDEDDDGPQPLPESSLKLLTHIENSSKRRAENPEIFAPVQSSRNYGSWKHNSPQNREFMTVYSAHPQNPSSVAFGPSTTLSMESLVDYHEERFPYSQTNEKRVENDRDPISTTHDQGLSRLDDLEDKIVSEHKSPEGLPHSSIPEFTKMSSKDEDDDILPPPPTEDPLHVRGEDDSSSVRSNHDDPPPTTTGEEV